MSDLIFSISNTFSLDVRDGALGRNDAKKFYIAPYQRGYKWSSATSNSPVQILMTDLIDAFAARPKEYYLQFITVTSSNHEGETVLEVIDGQQRLTTITLLFSVMNYRLKSEQKPFTENKLSYEVRENVSDFFDKFIYNNISELIELDWKALITQHPIYDEQDINYLFNAAKKINELLPTADLQEFHDYVANKVMLIVNKVEKTISCERIFSNLNTNKVELTSAELIKGLLLTKSVRENPDSAKVVPYREILEQRTAMGRQWDEIDNWCNMKAINSFFFNESKDPIHELLLLLAMNEGFKPEKNKDKYYLFNYFQSRIKKGEKSARMYFNEFKKLKLTLNDWYINPKIYNLMGFLFVAKASRFNLNSLIGKFNISKIALQEELTKYARDLVSTDIDDLDYGDNNEEIHDLLLSLSVFGSDKKFDFYSFKNNEWSLEHIFPQNPKKFSPELKQADIRLINSIIGSKLDIDNTETSSLKVELASKLKKESCTLNEEELILLCNLLQSKKINGIGNMALLTKPDNSSNGNGMFDLKRINIANRVSKGSFVPKHTYDVFSKLISDKMNPDLTVWSEEDINTHKEWIELNFKNLLFIQN
jgi:hypothetical protein